ncbi:hypothetical protein Tco_1360139 [Tanacetum coccineum]
MGCLDVCFIVSWVTVLLSLTTRNRISLQTTQMDNSLYIGVLLVGLLFVKGSWSGWAAYVEGNKVCVEDEPSWSPQYAVKGG